MALGWILVLGSPIWARFLGLWIRTSCFRVLMSGLGLLALLAGHMYRTQFYVGTSLSSLGVVDRVLLLVHMSLLAF
jgi:hypothetical protein